MAVIIPNILCCPDCGGDEFYRKTYMSGWTETYYRFDGNAAENGSLHDGLKYKDNKTAFCADCGKAFKNAVTNTDSQPDVYEK